MPEPRIRSRMHDDIAPLAEVLERVHLADRWPVCRPDDWATWLIVGDESASWVALDGRPVGHISVRTPPDAPSMLPFWEAATEVDAHDMVEITRLFIDPDVRSSGVGRRLFDTALDFALDTGKVPVLYTSHIDLGAQRLYERTGWLRAGSAPEVLPNGETLDMIAFTYPAANRATS